jgi:hypothetical protein
MITQKLFQRFLAVPFITVALLFAAGCGGGAPSQEELAKADYGTPISQEEAQKQATLFLPRMLKYPDSAQIQWANVKQGWIRNVQPGAGGLQFGYVLDANINTKNLDGSYIGYKPYKFIFYNGTIVSVYAQHEVGTGGDQTSYMRKIY